MLLDLNCMLAGRDDCIHTSNKGLMVHLELCQNPGHLHRVCDEGLPTLPLLLDVGIIAERQSFSHFSAMIS